MAADTDGGAELQKIEGFRIYMFGHYSGYSIDWVGGLLIFSSVGVEEGLV